MKKIYFLIIISFIFSLNGITQNSRKSSLSNIYTGTCKSCMPKATMVADTICNIEANDTLALYYADRTPYDSGWAIGQNAFLDKGWAERFTVGGNANVIGGVYLLYEKSKVATSGGIATAKVYTTTGTGGKPGTVLGSVNLPYASMVLNGTGSPFAFTAPIAVTNSFFMSLEFGTYALAGPDTIALIITRDGNRSTTNLDQNCALFKDDKWYFELTENYKLKVNYGLCAIVDIIGGMENYVSKGDLKIYAAYPNPATSDVTISYALANANKVSIEVFDAMGKSVLKLEKGKVSAGMNLEKINISSFAAGRYFYNVATDNGTLFSTFSVTK